MIPLRLLKEVNEPLRILCLGAHSDDIEIGCGGTVALLTQLYQQSEFHWVVFSAHGNRREEAEKSARLFAGANLNIEVLKTFRDGFMPFEGAQVKDFFENLKREVSPDLIFTHNRNDGHQDHRLIGDLTLNTFRDHFILEYEIPKYDGDMGQPNFFVPLEDGLRKKKVQYIIDTFRTQHGKRWFQPETFNSLMRLRGMECNAPSGYAEAFYCRKAVL